MLAELFNIFVSDIARWVIMKSKLYPKLAAMVSLIINITTCVFIESTCRWAMLSFV